MDRDEIVNLLRQTLPAPALAEKDVLQLADVAQWIEFPADTVVFREGQDHAGFYWILDGRVTLQMNGPAMKPISLLTVGAGEILAWSAMLGSKRMTATATTSTPTTMLRFDAQELRALCDRDHSLGYRVMSLLAESLSRRLLATRLQLLDLFRHPEEASQ